MKELTHKPKTLFPILASSALLLLFFIAYERNKFCAIHLHSWHESLATAYHFYRHNLLLLFFRNVDAYREHTSLFQSHAPDYFIGIVFGIFFSTLKTYSLVALRFINVVLITICSFLTLRSYAQRTDNTLVRYATVLLWITPCTINLMRISQNFFYGMFFLAMVFFVFAKHYTFKNVGASIGLALLLAASFLSHRIMILYSSFLYVHILFIFIYFIKKKTHQQWITFTIFSLFGLSPCLFFLYRLTQTLHLHTPPVQTNTLSLINHITHFTGLMLYNVGITGIVLLALSPVFFIANRKKKLSLSLCIRTLIPFNFVCLSVCFYLIFNHQFVMKYVFFVPTIPFFILFFLECFNALPKLLAKSLLTIKVLVIILFLLNNVFLLDLRPTLNVYSRSRSIKLGNLIYPMLIELNVETKDYMRDMRTTNHDALKLFTQLNDLGPFYHVMLCNFESHYNSLIETYTTQYNKKYIPWENPLVDKYSLEAHTILISKIVDRRRLGTNPPSAKNMDAFFFNESNTRLSANIMAYLNNFQTVGTVNLDAFIPHASIYFFKVQITKENRAAYIQLFDDSQKNGLFVTLIK